MSNPVLPTPDADLPPSTAAQRQQFEDQVRNSPAGLASLAGPAHLVTITNQLFRHLFGGRATATRGAA